MVSSLEKKIDETEKRYEEANRIGKEGLKQALEAESKLTQLKNAMQRLEEKLSDIESANLALQKQSQLNSSVKTLSEHISTPVAEETCVTPVKKFGTESDAILRRSFIERQLMRKRSETNQTIIIPLELLRHLKPAKFSDSQEYQMWQKRQLKVLEAGLLLYPSIPLEQNNSFATHLRDIVSNADSKPIDTGKNSDTMRTLCNSVVSLSWRSSNGTPTDVCYWADGFPFNMHLYTSLLQSIFDIRDDTLVLDEVDELFELMQKTWSTLGITLPIHNVCFTWVLFHQYIVTGQVEPDLLCASHAMLNEVA
ncbi:unnamed protein product [Lupinus luteus]|uniref:Uncharacterized protein n=1 Tax=Lupinus luteus TaxID=3873 RepID=A0AAV1XPB1_LUPLU